VRLRQLRIEQLRLFEQAEIAPGPRLNLLVGDNGAGKTSVLEAVHLLGYGRSFRAGARDAVIRHGADAARVFAEIEAPDGRHRLGLRRGSKDWEARIDGVAVAALSELFARCAVVTFEPGSHELIAGPAELRRRFLDWGLFHVEQEFLGVWRSYQRALRQRNALLREGRGGDQLTPWELELDRSGSTLDRMRQRYADALAPPLEELSAALFPSPGLPTLSYRPGWPRHEGALGDALAASRPRDLALGYTTLGPHRANWSIRYPTLPGRDSLSRGQEKLAALCCVLAQAQHYAGVRGDWPIICLDDLGSELDQAHQGRAAQWLAAQPAQVLVSGTEAPVGFDAGSCAMFHVERGQLRALL
jgi:DNA replication and repair protein RecF